MEKRPIAHLERYERAFGGDNAYYVIEGGKHHGTHVVVAVRWALLKHYETAVTVGTTLTVFKDARYVQPPEALRRLGFSIDGEVDFCDPETFRFADTYDREADDVFLQA